MRINWSKIGNISFIGVSVIGSLSAFVTMFATQEDVRKWIAAHTPHVTLYDLLLITQIAVVIVAIGALTLLVIEQRGSARLAAQVKELRERTENAKEGTQKVLTQMETLKALTTADLNKCKLRYERVEITANSRTRGTATVSLSVQWPYGRPLTISSLEVSYWRFDGNQIEPGANPLLKGVGTDVQPGGIVTFTLQLLEEEMTALLNALRTLQNTSNTAISGFFARGVTTVHTVGFAGFLIFRDAGKDVRLPIPAELYDLATLALNNVKNPFPPERDLIPSAKAPDILDRHFDAVIDRDG
jgi:ABC-type multidrug transport system fused ATPase/permease subunit